MPTKLSRPVTRVVHTLRDVPLVVTLAPEGIIFREVKRRTRYLLPYGSAFLDAIERHVQAERRAKAAEQKARNLEREAMRGPRGKKRTKRRR